ncbi:sterol 3-beta-glucosyltransferase [Candidatus Epulonipiscium fishelsonii]|uniref:Sterol 3-beta-glucosyltransferase n=1 Tax=Candidatus Epulonipiscium fishelsonii TaxID=77094 RepID=A0ACC8XFT1_9FIRM|nr:sterol 3-beta-glucosyltransferase [Epulopiscium sp. SCG-B11WGA-EpuloA1]ONI42524.1 sterol 3-beta-glucosyltransferase [Epulopiscium sp. SCG-B05WGA-EpuloA1]
MITIICSGSRGDFQPYIALAKELKKRGKDVRITAGKSQEDFVRSYGIDVFPISIDISNANVDPKLLEVAGSSDNPLKMLLTFNKMKHLGHEMLKETARACEGSELIIYHPGCAVGYFAAEEMAIPSVLASPFPIHKNDEYLSVVMYGKFKNTKKKRALSYKLLYKMLWMASSLSIKELWQEKYGRLPRNYGCTFDLHNNPRNPAIISCSNYIFNRPTTLNENIHQSGYFFLDEDDYTPGEELQTFLSSGEKPVYIGFGSMLKENEKLQYAQIAINALQKVNKRGILYGFGEIENLPSTIITVKTTPHSWLFPKMAAVCHHGGAGTSAEGFRAGVPSIIVPFSNDQFAWAYRSFDLGIGVRPIHKKDLTSDKLVTAITAAFDKQIVTNASEIGRKIKTETGLQDAVSVVLESLNHKF